MGAHRNFSREGQGTDDMASAVARAYNGGLEAAGSRARAPGQGSGGEAPLKLNTLKHLHTLRSPIFQSFEGKSSCPGGQVPLPLQKNPPKPPKIDILETEYDITCIWRITLQRNFTSTIAASGHYEGPSSVNPKSARTLTPK